MKLAVSGRLHSVMPEEVPGKEIDIDEFDTAMTDPQKQLIVWDPENKEIIGGYRFYFPEKGQAEYDIKKLASSSYFHFSDKFMKKYFPHLMELGRSFVHPDYQIAYHGKEKSFCP